MSVAVQVGLFPPAALPAAAAAPRQPVDDEPTKF
jgi:hypothetical protein